MDDSPRTFKLMRKAVRRMDKSVGNSLLANKPTLSWTFPGATLTRHDYGVGDFGIQLTLANASESTYGAAGAQVGDVVELLTGQAKGAYLLVTAVTDSTHLRLTDIASFTGTETGAVVRIEISTVVKSYY